MTSNSIPNMNSGEMSTSDEKEEPSAGQELQDFVATLGSYTPTVPDPVISYFVQTAGFQTTDSRVIRLISIAAQKFISDIANDALHHCKMRGVGQNKKAQKDKRYTLTMDDLTPALSEYGINVKKPRFVT